MTSTNGGTETDVDLEAVERFVNLKLEAAFKVTDAEREEVMSDVRGLLERPMTEDQVAYPLEWAGTAVDVKAEIVDGVDERFGFAPIDDGDDESDAGKEPMTDGGTDMETISLAGIHRFPTDIKHPETDEWVRVVGYHRPTKYGSGVLAYVDPETGEYGGMLTAHDDTESVSPMVETRPIDDGNGGDD